MIERDRLDDFQGGGVACRRCHAILEFAPGDVTPQQCCGLLYRPEYLPMVLVIYDQLATGDIVDPVALRPPLPPVPELPAVRWSDDALVTSEAAARVAAPGSGPGQAPGSWSGAGQEYLETIRHPEAPAEEAYPDLVASDESMLARMAVTAEENTRRQAAGEQRNSRRR